MQRPRRVKRQFAAALLALVLGALLTIGIAWKAARNVPDFGYPGEAHWSAAAGLAWLYRQSEAQDGLWSATRLDGIAATAWSASGPNATCLKAAPRGSKLLHPPDDESSPNGGNPQIIEESFGWPLRALSCAHVPSGNRTMWTVVDGIELKRHPEEQFRWVALPLRPLLGGFLVDTLLNATVLWVLLVPSFILFKKMAGLCRFLRQRRGLCPSCGYDLQRAFDQGCPECGWQRPPASATTVGQEDASAR